MISSSVPLMTLIDLVFIAGAAYLVHVFLRCQEQAMRLGVVAGLNLVLLGVLVLTLFYVLDLLTMHVVPLLLSPQAGMRAMAQLHLNLPWFIGPIGVGLMVIGLLHLVRRLIPKALDNVERLESAVQARTRERESAYAKLAEEERTIRESEAQFRQAAKMANLGHWTWDEVNQKYLSISDEYARIHGCTVEEYVELYPSTEAELELVHPDDRALYVEEYAAGGETGSADIRHRIVTRDGVIRYCREIGQFTVDDEGRVTRVVGTLQDLTEREHLVAELESKNAELERFAYTVSHDLKGPLITIRGFLGLLENDISQGDSARVETDLQRIDAAARKMHHLLDDLLELSRIGPIPNRLEHLPLGDVVREALTRISQSRGVEIVLSPDLPVVYADPTRLVEVMQNLIANAIQYMGDQPAPRIEIGVRQEANTSVVYVRDNGIGIEPRYQQKVFGLFERLSADTEGTGVGLTIASRIIDTHGGRLWVESGGDGEGSTFYFTLSAREAAGGAPTAVPPNTCEGAGDAADDVAIGCEPRLRKSA